MKPISVILIALMAFSAIPTGFADAATAASRPDVLKSLRDWRTRIIDEDERASANQKKLVVSLSKIRFKRNFGDAFESQNADRELETPLSEISKIDDERVELEARRRIVDQIIFAVDTKWSGADLRSFLETQLLDFAVTDLSEPGQGGWWRFLIQAAVSLRETAEPGADPVKFLEAYTSQSGVLQPKSALDVLKSRNYVGD